MYNKVDIIKCKKCDNEIGWINYLQEWSVAVNACDWRCLTCYELEILGDKQRKEDLKKPLAFPENWEKIKKINERKIELIDETIKELEQQRTDIKLNKNR